MPSKPSKTTPAPKKPAPKASAPKASSPSAAQAPSTTERWAAVSPESIPAPPASFVSTPIQQRRIQLRFIPYELKAEALLAFEEVASRGAATVQQELGPNVADTSGLGGLIAQIKSNDQAVQAAEALLAYLTERGQYLESDALKLLDDVAEEVDHLAKKKPAITRSYARTLAYYEGKGRAISAGVARSREKKAGAKEDKKTDGEE